MKPHGGVNLALRRAAKPPRVVARFDSIRTERLLMRRWRDADRVPRPPDE